MKMTNSSRFSLTGWIFALLVSGLLGSQATHAADELLPVEQAFKIEAKATGRDAVAIEITIADNYYLYRNRVKVSTTDAGATLGALDLPVGEKKHDEFLGDVEVYHHGLKATQHLSVTAEQSHVALVIGVQGCHQVDPKICFPPFKTTLDIALPGAAAATGSGSAPAITLNGAGSNPSLLNNGPLPAEQAFKFEAIATGSNEILARWTMPKGYYLYRDKTQLSVSGEPSAALSVPRWPVGVTHSDANFGATTVYYDQVEVPVAVTRPGAAENSLTVSATFQGCLENNVCYPPMMRSVVVTMPAAGASASAAARPVAANTESGPSDSQFKRALSGSLWLTFGVFFLAGLGLAFTPCVFPLIPILSGIIAGAGDNLSTRRALTLSFVYILANAVIFTIAGVIAGLAGKNLQAAFQTPWVLWCFAGIFVLLALSMFGFYELQLPSSWQSKLANASNKQSGGSLFGVAIMGALSALIVGPCVTPPLAVAVLYIAQTNSPVLGGFALFALALGMGAPLLVFGASAGKLLPRAGAWMDAVKAIFGVTFLGLSIWMLSRVLDAVWIMLLAGGLAVASAVYLGALERLAEGASGWRRLWKSFGVVLLILGAAEIVGAAAGSDDLLQPLRGVGASGVASSAETTAALPFTRIKSLADVTRELAAAKAAGKPAMLDFYADWCVSCKEMEKFTFPKAQVRAALQGFVLLQADVTANDEIDQALMRNYRIVAPPDTLFFSSTGAEQQALQLTGPEHADEFVQRINAVGK